MTKLATFILVIFVVASGAALADKPATPTPEEIFEQRIMPIFKSPQPASCVQCHLAGVDLKDYIRPSHEQTFASLREGGLIDLADPKKSKILTLIDKGKTDPDKKAQLIHEKTRLAEFAAFEAWITACCNDSKLRELPRIEPAKLAQPQRPNELIRHARKSRLVESFTRNVWSQRMRCFPCHTPHEIDASNPKHKNAIEKHQDFLERDDKAYAGRMNIFKETPEATLQYLIDKSRSPAKNELPLINLKDPRKSLLVLKPTAKVPKQKEDGDYERPTYSEPVSHLGGLKMNVDDPSYKAFVAWIQDYSRVVADKYTSVAELPADNWFPSKHVVLVKELPASWPDRARVQLFVHAWNDQTSSWEKESIAFTQNSITPKGTVGGPLFVFRTESKWNKELVDLTKPDNAKLKTGKYLLKAYVDRKSKLEKDPTILLDESDFVGKTEIQANWREGWPGAETVVGKDLKK
jgi:hypothetical protein